MLLKTLIHFLQNPQINFEGFKITNNLYNVAYAGLVKWYNVSFPN